jgi:hypothetical protein
MRSMETSKPSVDKPRDIHSMTCAKATFLPDRSLLSHNHPASIPPFYSDFKHTQVFDPVDKKGLVHKKIDVYYYYQNIYIQVNLKQ